jgi:hypothetical protein
MDDLFVDAKDIVRAHAFLDAVEEGRISVINASRETLNAIALARFITTRGAAYVKSTVDDNSNET